MSDRLWIKLIAPAYGYRGRGNRWVNVKDTCYHRSKTPELAARALLGTRRRLQLFVDNREYDLPFKGVGVGSTYTIEYLDSAIAHIRHCVELHMAFYNE
jgi:hypothetical protein